MPVVIVAYSGAIAPEAIEAIGLMAEDRRDVGLLAVTSADRLNAGWTAALRARVPRPDRLVVGIEKDSEMGIKRREALFVFFKNERFEKPGGVR